MSESVPISKIKLNAATQARLGISQDTVDDYAASYAAGKTLPDVTLFTEDGRVYFPGDGWHRTLARKKLNLLDVDAEVKEGNERDALLYACGANQNHGLTRTNADKRKAIERMLQDKEWARWSDAKVADHVGVGQTWVSAVRRNLTQHTAESNSSEDPPRPEETPTLRTGRDGRTINTSNIGKKGKVVLCDRCIRVGAVKDCAACRIAQRATQGDREPGDDTDQIAAEKKAEKDAPKNGAAVPTVEAIHRDLIEATKKLDHAARHFGMVKPNGDLKPDQGHKNMILTLKALAKTLESWFKKHQKKKEAVT